MTFANVILSALRTVETHLTIATGVFWLLAPVTVPGRLAMYFNFAELAYMPIDHMDSIYCMVICDVFDEYLPSFKFFST